jgi:Mg2+/Co2+ transporter CorC
MSDDFDSIVGDIDDELDLTLYADAKELSEEVTVQILASIERGLKLIESISLSSYRWNSGRTDIRSSG